jgi:5-methylcytosine-specific restriction endonuclease McrA
MPATRATVMLRDAYICQYCADTPGHSHLTVDHIVPRSRGGVHDWHNLVTACKRCNQKKGSHTPEESMMHLLRKPFEPSYMALVLLSNPVAAAHWERLMGLTKERYTAEPAVFA